MDGAGDACDCDPLDDQVWSVPGPINDLMLSDDNVITTLSWSPPANPGSVVLVYDTVLSTVASDFVAFVVCVESDDGVDTQSFHMGDPLPGEVYNFLIRPENGCGGYGGSNSAGVTRPIAPCP